MAVNTIDKLQFLSFIKILRPIIIALNWQMDLDQMGVVQGKGTTKVHVQSLDGKSREKSYWRMHYTCTFHHITKISFLCRLPQKKEQQ